MIVVKLLSVVFILIMLMNGCSFSDDESPAVAGQPFLYVKRSLGAIGNPIDSVTFNEGGDLYLRFLSTPSAEERNLTGHLTLGKGDVSDPEPSFDGEKIVFAMRCTSESSQQCLLDATWNIWIYTHQTNNIHRVIKDSYTADLGDDVDPAFLPDGRIIFTSTRQKKTKSQIGYSYLDKDAGSVVTTLHVMNEDGTEIEQISFNQSHDRNPSVLRSGKVLFSRWDHVGHKSKFSLYTVNPDGTDLNVLYGAHSPGDSFLHAREVSEGRIVSTVIPMQGTWEGGALMELDVKNFSDNDDPAPGFNFAGMSGQKPATLNDIPIGRQKSPEGRFSVPYALADGSGEVLVSYSPFQPVEKVDPITKEVIILRDQEGPPVYGIYLLDINTKSLKPIVLPETGFAFTDPVVLEPRTLPPEIARQIVFEPGVFDPEKEEGLLNIKSVYDTDRRGRMSNGILTRVEQAAMSIPMVPPTDITLDTRNLVADIAKLKDPLLTTADQRPARFLRVTTGIPTPPGLSRQAIGETVFEMQKIIGYAPIEPDGSVRIKVPADIPLSLSVLDREGRAYENHTSWLQVRPGEELVCHGCHSPQRSGALNVAPIAGNHPNTRLKKIINNQSVQIIQDNNADTFKVFAQPEETMAETRVRVDKQALELTQDLIYFDVWTDETVQAPTPSFKIEYTDISTGSIPEAGLINYVEHIQPLWDARNLRGRGGVFGKQCVDCHNGSFSSDENPTGLNLTRGISGKDGRLISYSQLILGKPFFDEEGKPVLEVVDGIPFLRRKIPDVEPGYARGSYLIEKLFNEELYAEEGLPLNGLDHRNFLTPAERRLVVEWLDVGAQYQNTPFDECGIVQTVAPSLQRGALFTDVAIVLSSVCNRCHRVFKRDGSPNPQFVRNSFILTGDVDGDFYATASMVTDIVNPEKSYLVDRPSSLQAEHPRNSGGKPWLPVGSDGYKAFIKWIKTAQDAKDGSESCS